MSWSPPDAATVFKAIEVYLKIAYRGKPPPTAIRGRLDTLHACEHELFDSPAWERAATAPQRFTLRLGNFAYPHMKLVIEPSPDGEGYLVRADTHDKHISLPPGSREHDAFAALMHQNQQIAGEIESAWTAASIPTFKEFLRRDLARRAQAAQSV
jgi:hypothetical protein